MNFFSELQFTEKIHSSLLLLRPEYLGNSWELPKMNKWDFIQF